jgi:hypothetical protein
MAFEREYFSPREAAFEIGIPETSVKFFMQTGKLRASNLGTPTRKRWVITRKNLEAFVESMAVEGQHSCVATAGEGAE